MSIILRNVKGTELTHGELDQNFIDLRDGVNLQVPKTMGKGLKLGPNGTETFGWHDLICDMHYHDGAADAPETLAYIGGIQQYAFEVDDSVQIIAHMPHDYAMGSDIYIHCHWSHNSQYVTGGSVTWGFELTYAKGHNQMAFTTPVTIVEFQNASTIRYQHMICEALASASGGGENILDTDDMEVDGLFFGRIFLSANNLTVSQGLVPTPFLHEVDVHYQSTGVPTKSRAPNFWV